MTETETSQHQHLCPLSVLVNEGSTCIELLQTLLPLPQSSPITGYHIGDTKKPTYTSFTLINSRRIPGNMIDEAREYTNKTGLRYLLSRWWNHAIFHHAAHWSRPDGN